MPSFLHRGGCLAATHVHARLFDGPGPDNLTAPAGHVAPRTRKGQQTVSGSGRGLKWEGALVSCKSKGALVALHHISDEVESVVAFLHKVERAAAALCARTSEGRARRHGHVGGCAAAHAASHAAAHAGAHPSQGHLLLHHLLLHHRHLLPHHRHLLHCLRHVCWTAHASA
eukprot:CAMPEP_0174725874 /NCGR_PEP_ID=MMETSP1094-20130205/46595_1 /TAXON_ID=156173 /ORGANISM="Chrysochromulina brevifilum, Strain UTEX LB 985" /LENGTH=170 /DNA_ID=CAMNT_0015927357 /DNA_START=218 /DNA_END=727 /DNA_ORIENTATION=+